MNSGDSNIPTLPASATWTQSHPRDPQQPRIPGPTDLLRPEPVVGQRTELTRYTVPEASGSRDGNDYFAISIRTRSVEILLEGVDSTYL
jgi:hypothetical protein